MFPELSNGFTFNLVQIHAKSLQGIPCSPWSPKPWPLLLNSSDSYWWQQVFSMFSPYHPDQAWCSRTAVVMGDYCVHSQQPTSDAVCLDPCFSLYLRVWLAAEKLAESSWQGGPQVTGMAFPKDNAQSMRNGTLWMNNSCSLSSLGGLWDATNYIFSYSPAGSGSSYYFVKLFSLLFDPSFLCLPSTLLAPQDSSSPMFTQFFSGGQTTNPAWTTSATTLASLILRKHKDMLPPWNISSTHLCSHSLPSLCLLSKSFSVKLIRFTPI